MNTNNDENVKKNVFLNKFIFVIYLGFYTSLKWGLKSLMRVFVFATFLFLAKGGVKISRDHKRKV